MAKTFKKNPAATEPVKPISERDFFDLSDDEANRADEITKTTTVHNLSNTGNTSITGIKGNTSNKDVSSKPAGNQVTVTSDVPASEDEAAEGVRQTFVLSRGHLEQLRDYVHARRARGEYTYSQKQALQEALDLLFASAEPVAPRPAQTRAQEQQRRQRIQRGRRAGAGG